MTARSCGMRTRFLPTWNRVFAAAIAVLLVNLLWHEPLERATGGGTAAYVLLNVLPSALAVFYLLFERRID